MSQNDPLAVLRAIRDARDYHAEHGRYPDGTLGPDQEFDDWAADMADTVLSRCYSVTYNPPGRAAGSRVDVLLSCGDLEQAEAFVASRYFVDPIGVDRGDYGIDGPTEGPDQEFDDWAADMADSVLQDDPEMLTDSESAKLAAYKPPSTAED